ncbi:hypothetical protein [Deinococcus sp.]|uniref:hypothetical protein n=1 Tax=Deinococcus sp. TaxID=47478 RepID=UPI0025F7AB45|nr:hypothetical protein [Deinococcus sp.]
MPPPSLTFLHTSPVHVATFDALLAELAPEIPVRHIVEEALLERARAEDVAAVSGRLSELLRELEGRAAVLVCTCSTIGNATEALGSERLPVMRIDRPMAEAAVKAGQNGAVLILAALDSTLGPTRALIEDAARKLRLPASIQIKLCTGAWTLFESGDLAGYTACITTELDSLPEPLPAVVVLAQASMAPAATQTRLSVPVLSSPRLGAQAAVALYRQTT